MNNRIPVGSHGGTARNTEIAKYHEAYRASGYGMGKIRRAFAVADLAALPVRGSYLDVSTGRGEMLTEAEALGFESVQGTEVVPSLIDGARVTYAEAHELPFAAKSFDVVTMFDVIEHLLPGDDQMACMGIRGIAAKRALISASNVRSRSTRGDDLHINKRPYEGWDAVFRQWFYDARVVWLHPGESRVSETWRIDF